MISKQEKSELIKDLSSIIGEKYILTAEWSMEPYCKGWRYGKGKAIAVAKPGSLIEIWKVLKFCLDKNLWYVNLMKKFLQLIK